MFVCTMYSQGDGVVSRASDFPRKRQSEDRSRFIRDHGVSAPSIQRSASSALPSTRNDVWRSPAHPRNATDSSRARSHPAPRPSSNVAFPISNASKVRTGRSPLRWTAQSTFPGRSITIGSRGSTGSVTALGAPIVRLQPRASYVNYMLVDIKTLGDCHILPLAGVGIQQVLSATNR